MRKNEEIKEGKRGKAGRIKLSGVRKERKKMKAGEKRRVELEKKKES